MASTTELEPRPPPTVERPPAVQVGVIGWLRKNLFSSWVNSLLTVLALLLLYNIIPPLINWLVVKAVWGPADPAACKEASGAPRVFDEIHTIGAGSDAYRTGYSHGV